MIYCSIYMISLCEPLCATWSVFTVTSIDHYLLHPVLPPNWFPWKRFSVLPLPTLRICTPTKNTHRACPRLSFYQILPLLASILQIKLPIHLRMKVRRDTNSALLDYIYKHKGTKFMHTFEQGITIVCWHFCPATYIFALQHTCIHNKLLMTNHAHLQHSH